MFTRLAQIALGFTMLSLPFLTKKEDDFSRKSGTQILDEAINKLEQEDTSQVDSDEQFSEPINSPLKIRKRGSETNYVKTDVRGSQEVVAKKLGSPEPI